MNADSFYSLSQSLWHHFGPTPPGIIGDLWILFCLYWLVSALNGKKTKRRESFGQRMAYVLPLVAAFSASCSLNATVAPVPATSDGSRAARVTAVGVAAFAVPTAMSAVPVPAATTHAAVASLLVDLALETGDVSAAGSAKTTPITA